MVTNPEIQGSNKIAVRAEMGSLSKIMGINRLERVRNTGVRDSLKVGPLLFSVEKHSYGDMGM